jgi:hypothetical protein
MESMAKRTEREEKMWRKKENCMMADTETSNHITVKQVH